MMTFDLPNLGATHLNHICDNAFDARQRGLPKSNLADCETNFDAYRAYELGWYRAMTAEDFLELQEQAERLDLAHAKGEDLPGHYKRRALIEEILEAGPWTMNMDSSRPERRSTLVA